MLCRDFKNVFKITSVLNKKEKLEAGRRKKKNAKQEEEKRRRKK